MEENVISPYWLALLFIVVAFFYSSVGLGGGSSYMGAFLGSSKLSPRTMQKMLGLIVLVAIVFLSRKMLTL